MPAGRYTLYFMLVDCLDCDDYYSVADIIVHPGNSKLLKEIMAALLKQYEKEMADFESLTKNASGLSIRHQAPARPTEDVLIRKAKSSLSNGKSRHFNKTWQGLALPGNRAWLGKYWKILRKETFEPESYPWEVAGIKDGPSSKKEPGKYLSYLKAVCILLICSAWILINIHRKNEVQPDPFQQTRELGLEEFVSHILSDRKELLPLHNPMGLSKDELITLHRGSQNYRSGILALNNSFRSVPMAKFTYAHMAPGS